MGFVVIGCATALILGILAIPLDLTIDIERGVTSRIRTHLAWMNGYVRLRIGGTRKGRARPGAPPSRSRPSPRRRRAIGTVLAIVRTPGFLSRISKFGATVTGRITIRELHLRLRVGLDDPADTGCLMATLAPVVLSLRALTRVDVACDPDFSGPGLRGRCVGVIRTRPLRVLGPAVAFVASPTVVRAFMNGARVRRR